ncbi:amino acid adenylation domain-containing protein [Streptomyces sp. NPDC004376]
MGIGTGMLADFEHEYLPLSPAQLGVWAAQQLDSGSPRYNCAAYLRIHGSVDEGLMRRAVNTALGDAEALRVRFDDGGQTITPVADEALELVDLSGEDDPVAAAEEWMRADLARPVDLGAGPLIRHALIKEEEQSRLLYLRHHHIVLDGFGQTLHLRRISEVYTALVAGELPSRAPYVPLRELLAEDLAYAASASKRRDREYWLRKMADRPSVVSLSGRAPKTARSVLRRTAVLGEADTALLYSVAEQLGTTPPAVLVSAVAAYVGRSTAQRNVVLNLPVPARRSKGSRITPAMLANQLPLRVEVDRESSFAMLVGRVTGDLTDALRHQRYRGEDLYRDLGLSGSQDQLAGATVNVLTSTGTMTFAGVPTSSHLLSAGPVRDISFNFLVDPDASSVGIVIAADPDLYSPDALTSHEERLLVLLRDALRTPDEAVARLRSMLPEERDAVLRAGRGSECAYDVDLCLHERVERQACITPDAVAVQADDASLTYRQLVDRARGLAADLRSRGAAPGCVVGIHNERSLDLVVELLAVLMTGAAYLPLDPELPRDRLAYQIADAGVRIVLSRSDLAPQLTGVAADIISVDTTRSDSPESAWASVAVDPGDHAYVIYTSGSTGRPKGVAVPHRGIVNRLLWMQDQFQLGAEDRVLQKTPFTFDVSVWEFFWPLLTGARLHLAKPGAHRDPRAISETIRDQRITTVHFVPTMLDLFLAEPTAAELSSLRLVMASGEALHPETVSQFFAVYGDGGTSPELHNLYGPTEASVDVTHWKCGPENSHNPVPIGRPIANTSIYVLDPGGEPVPFDTPGELHIGGVQLASGYLNQPRMTAESFVDNPFAAGRMYRTGDLAILRRDGTAEYLGRLDQQVKIRGFRVELGEIESLLLSHPAVAQAAVVTSRQGERQLPGLVAHVVPADTPVDAAELLSMLRGQLPPYMVPAHLHVLDTMPLLPSGKADRSALRKLNPTAETADGLGSEPPATPAEHLLHDVWCDVLGLGSVDVLGSFFALGGDSILSIRMRAALERRGMTFPLAELYHAPSVRELAPRLRSLDAAAATRDDAPFSLISPSDRELLPSDVEDAYPLSNLQSGIVFHAGYEGETSVYRVVTSVRVELPFDEDALRRALARVFRRHPALRTSFHLSGFSEPLQLVHRDVDIPLEVHADLGTVHSSAQGASLRQWAERAKFHEFDLSAAPLLSFSVHLLGADAFQLGVVEHHVVLDGWSDGLMFHEIIAQYRAALASEDLWLPDVPSTFRQFVAAERAAVKSPEHRAFWAEELDGAQSTPLPDKAPTGHGDGSEHRRYDVTVDAVVGARLAQIARRAQLPLKSLLTAVHVAVLQRVCPGDEVLTGVISHARLDEDGGDAVIGVFLNTLPLRMDARGVTWLELAGKVQAHTERTFPHRGYPYGRIKSDHSDLHLDSYVNFMDFHQEQGAGSAPLDGFGIAETEFPLSVNFMTSRQRGGFDLWLDCDTTRLQPDFCERLAGYYGRALAELAAQPEAQADAIELRGEGELRLLQSWNATAQPYEAATTVHGLIERQVLRSPESVALAHRWAELSYEAMDERANQLAHHLMELGVRRGNLVGVSLRRGTDMVIALLGVLKAGAAYVPLDPAFPASRLKNIAADASLVYLITGPGAPEEVRAPKTVDLVGDAPVIAALPKTRVDVPVDGDDLAYVIYTSGSTGQPKGTAIRHRNVVNFFTGMDGTVGCGQDDVMLAVTSISFDISVLELLWPLSCGAKVVIAGERIIKNLTPAAREIDRAVNFSLFFFAASARGSNRDGYRLILDAARYADTHGFEAVWTPERHFHEFGGLYPNPAVMSAALATITQRVALRCGSVVAPLHDSVRMAEEWSLVDNLSNGRIGMAFAPGWNSNDFVFFPDNYPVRKQRMVEQLAEFRRLWHGEAVQRVGGSCELVDVRIFPAPVQDDPPIWLTSVGTIQTFEQAGAAGVNVLTHLLGQSPRDLADKISAYRRAREKHGHPGRGQVTVMVHAFMSGDADEAKQRARGPFRDYLRSSTELWRTLFATTGQEMPENGAEEYLEPVLDMAVERYFETSGLFGSPDSCADLIRTLSDVGVDEVACLVDFGLDTEDVLSSLTWINRLREAHQEEADESGHSLTELCKRHSVTLFQGTPSLLSAVVTEPDSLAALRGTRALLVGGEAFPSGLAERLLHALPHSRVLNMYGPTETTIWSTSHELTAEDAAGSGIPIGRPIANTEVRVVGNDGALVPLGVEGELWIGGAGVAAGYVGRPELTTNRFVQADDAGEPFYRTGDRVRWRGDGSLEFLGRVDRQVKILGHRVEPDEVESVLSRHPEVDAVAVVAVSGEAGIELVAYVAPTDALADRSVQDAYVDRWSEIWQETYAPSGEQTPGTAFLGWNSSYSGKPIPEAEMEEWLQHTVQRIRALRPSAVADIGVGVGLILRELADQVDHYVGLDISAAALASAATCLGAERTLPPHVVLRQSGPEYLAEVPPHGLDLVVLNSVAQYFPGVSYLRDVIEQAIRVVRPGGAIFVGDVRSVEMLPEFHTLLQFSQAPELQTAGAINAAVTRDSQNERELCLSPKFFRRLTDEFPEIGEVRIELKRGEADNELSMFRYDVTLLIGEPPADVPVPEQTDWSSIPEGLIGLEKRLRQDSRATTVRGIPNKRLARALAASRLLGEVGEETTLWELERLLWELDETTDTHPEEVAALATRLGRNVRLLVPQNGRLDHFDAFFDKSEGDI